MAAESMSLRDMLFWFFITLFGTGTYVIYGSQTPTGQMLGIAMMVVGFVGMFCCAWPHLARYLNSRPRLTAVFFVVSLAVLTFIMHSHQQYHGWRSYVIIGVLCAVLLCVCWLIAGVVPKSVMTRAVETEPEPATGDTAKAIVKAGPPITLKQLFEIGWPSLPTVYMECEFNSQIFDSGSVKVAWRVNGDFVGRSKFLAILIDPTTKAGDAFKACEAIADQYGHFIDSANSEVDIEGQAPDDTAPTHLKDMVFSKRIFIYYEEFSLAQKGLLETIYQSKELSVQFRDAAYAWAHRDDKPRATPLVPNTTILPDAKLIPGLRIKITKLSPGMENKAEVVAADVTEPKAKVTKANIHPGKVHSVGIHMGSDEILRRGSNPQNQFVGALLLEITNRLEEGRAIESVLVKAHVRLCQERNQEIVTCPAVWLNERHEVVEIPAGEQREIVALMGGAGSWYVPKYIGHKDRPPEFDTHSSIWQQEDWSPLEVTILLANGDARDGEVLGKFEYYWRWRIQSHSPDVAFKQRRIQ